MDVEAVNKALTSFVEKHKAAFTTISARQSQLLELAAIVGVELHYASNGYETKIESPPNAQAFVVKTNTRGHPGKYSLVHMRKENCNYEAHMNLLVRGAHDEGIYSVDVGIAKAGTVPKKIDKKVKWLYTENEDLVSFAEVKRLTVYPMLLAQFVGIVHEIKPAFLHDTGADFGQFTKVK